MNSPNTSYRIFPLGDAAITIDFGNVIDETVNQKVLTLFQQFRNSPLPGMMEVVPAYSSVTIHYDLFSVSRMVPNGGTAYEFISAQVNERMKSSLPDYPSTSGLVNIPVCYDKEFAPDLDYLAKEKGIPISELIQLHTSKQYHVYMLGFLPGFTYMGEVKKSIAMPRKPHPVMVAAGSVGIAGRQTGIYPFSSPGGWHIIGRTPVKLFDAAKTEPALLKAGDKVQFISISKNEFENY